MKVKMQIKSPLVNKKEVRPLCEAGAAELFCGIEPYDWRRKYKNFSINQRSIGANFTKLADLEKAIQIAHRYRVKVHVAVNAFFYLEEQYRMLREIIRDLLNIGVDGIIFAEPTLLLNIDKNLLKSKDVVIGCDTVILNSATVSFYKKLGATRVVLPRAMTIQEMEEVIKIGHSIEHEVFIIHDLCFFDDGLCTYCKEATGGLKKEGRGRNKIYLFSASRIPGRGYGGGCRTRFRRQRRSISNNKRIGKINPFTFWMKKHIEGCGACAIYDLKRIGVASLKVLDRNLPSEEKVKATRFIRECLGGLLKDNGISKSEYIENCKRLFKKTFKVCCGQFDCYYPSVFLYS
jgi:collagenase-like PrtC family protease